MILIEITKVFPYLQIEGREKMLGTFYYLGFRVHYNFKFFKNFGRLMSELICSFERTREIVNKKPQ